MCQQMKECTVDELKASLHAARNNSGDGMVKGGLALDIDETLAATNLAWFERLIEHFGNPEGLTVTELIDKYHLAQNNPAWQSEEAQAWMHQQRTAPEAQDCLPVIPGAVEGVKELLQSRTNLVAYLTVRPQSVNANTIAWLCQCGFPALPVVAKPDDVAFEKGNQWKAESLHALYPHVAGIVDDNPKVPTLAGSHYPGDIFLFGRDRVEPHYEWAIPCQTWPQVVQAVRARMNKHSSSSSLHRHETV